MWQMPIFMCDTTESLIEGVRLRLGETGKTNKPAKRIRPAGKKASRKHGKPKFGRISGSRRYS